MDSAEASIPSAAFSTCPYITYETFRKVCLTIGKAVSVAPNASAAIPAYKINLDMGIGLATEHKAINHDKPYYTSSAQLCANHTEEDLIGRLILTVINFPRKQIGKMMSDCLVTGVQKEGLGPDEKRTSTVFMTTSHIVDGGARVSILAEKEILKTNPRDIVWTDFLALDLRIGTVEAYEICLEKTKEINTVLFHLNLGGEMGLQLCVGLLNKEYDLSSLIGRQVLVLINLGALAKKELFGIEEIGPVLLTVGGGSAVLEPAKPVENGFKLA